jgi:hypothetical protein
LLNIFYYNFHLIDYYFSKFLVIYLNPFTWISNIKRIKSGWNSFKRSMEKNFPDFLDLSNTYYLTNGIFILILTFFIGTFLNLFLAICRVVCTNRSNYILFVISCVISLILFYLFILKNNKFQVYHQEFCKEKKYNYPFFTLFLNILIFIFWICSTLFWVNFKN